MDVHLALYATIKNFELAERIRREDLTFDAFEFIAHKLDHKSATSLRNMCQPRSASNAAKLGLEEACAIIEITGDKLLLDWATQKIASTKCTPSPLQGEGRGEVGAK